MNEEVLNDLYSRAQYNGYKKSKDEFKTLLYSNEEVLNDNFEYVKSNGYQKSIDDFKVLIGSTEGKPTNFTNGSQEPSSPSVSAPQSTSPKVEEVPLMLQGKTPEDKYVPDFTKDIDVIKKMAEESNQLLLKEEKQLYDNIQALKVITPQDEEQKAQVEAEGRRMQEQYFAIQDKKEELLRERGQVPIGTNSGAIRNSLVEGFSGYAEDASKFTLDLMAKIFPSGLSPELRDKSSSEIKESIDRAVTGTGIKKTLDEKLKTASTNQEYVDKLKEESMLWAGGLGLAESAYLMSSPKMTGFFVTGYVAGSDIINEKYPDMPESGKLAYQTAYGTVSILSERLGLTNLVANNPLTKRIVNQVITKATQEALGKITSKGIGKAANEVLESYVSEGESGAFEYLGQELEGQVVDVLMNEDKFENKSLSKLAEEAFEAFNLEGIGGIIMKSPSTVAGGVSEISSAVGGNNPSIVNDVLSKIGVDPNNISVNSFNKISELAKDPEKVSLLKDALQISVNKDQMSQGKAEEILQKVESIVEIKNSIPAKLSTEKQMQAFNLIEERKGIEASIEGKDKAIVTAEKEQIDAINRELAVLGGAKREEGEVLYSETKQKTPTKLDTFSQENLIFLTENLGDNEAQSIGFSTLSAIPSSLRDKAVPRYSDITVNGKKENRLSGYDIEVTGKELRDLKQEFEEGLKQQDNAVQEQSTTAIPVQPEATVGEEVAQGTPEAGPEVTAQQGQEKNQEEVTLKTTNTNEENGIQEGGESGNEVISQGLQGEGKEGGQNVQEQEKALPQEVSNTAPTGIVSEETAQAIPAQPQPDALKDVESTTKALEGVSNENILSKIKTFSINGLKNFYHASQYKRKGRLRKSNAPQFGTGIYFSSNKDLVKNEFGENVTNTALNLSNPVFTNTPEWNKVTRRAIELADAEYGKSKNLKLLEDESYFKYDPDNLSEIDEIPSNFISDAAQELGYDAIIDEDSSTYENEIVVLDESKIIYDEDIPFFISEAYHRAKKDDSNPALVEAVEVLLGQKTEGASEGVSQVQPDTEATKEPLAEKYAKVESAKLQSTVTEDLKSGYTQKEIREALSEAGIDKAVSSTLISEAKQANALEKLTEVADAVSKSMKVKNLTKELFVELVKDLASKTKELQKVLEVLRKKPDLSKAEVMRINSLANLEKLGKMGANELFDLIEQVNRSAERRGKNSKLKDLFKKLNKVKDLVGGKGSQIDIMTKTNPNIFTEEQIDRAIELLEPIVASGKNINAKQLKEASKGIKEILDEKDLLVKNENLLVNEALGQLQSKLGEDYDLEDFIEAMKGIYGLSEDDTTVKILASRESLKRAYRYFNNVSNPVDQKELEKENEQNKEEKSAKKIEEIMSVRAIVQSKITQLKSAKIMQTLKDNGFGLLELEDVNTLLSVSPETFSRLSLSDLNQLSNILDNLSDGFYNGISGRLVAKISGLDEVIKIEKRSKTIKSAIDRTKLDIINAIKNGRDKISAELGAAKDKEATAQRKAKQKLDIYYKTIGSMSNLFDVISRNVVRPVIDAVDAALSKADTFTVKVSKDFVEAMVNAKNKWDKDVSNSKFRKKVKEKYGFDPKSASPDLIMVMLTTELQHLANNEDKTSYPAKNIISVRGLAGIDDVNGTSYGGNQHLQELKEAFIDKDGVLDLKKTNEFLQEFGFDKPILKARELMKTMRPYAVTASMRNYGVALDAREDYTPRGQQGYTDTEQAILDLLSPESYGIGVNSPNLFARTATFGENVEWDFQKLITRYVDTIAKELYVKPVIRKNQVVVNELKQTGNSNAQTLAYVLEAMIETLKADGKPSSFATKNPTMYRLIQTLKLNILSSNFKYVSETLMTLAGQFVANPKDIVRGIQLWGKGFGKSEQEGDDILSKLMSVARGSSNSAAIFAIQERQIENREQIKTSTSGTVMPQESRTIVQRLTDSLKTSKFNQLLRDKAIKSNTKLQRNLDKIPRGVGWLGAFDRRFEELTGNKFDYDKIDDPAYIAENSDAISESQSHADTRVKKFVGPGSVREASMEFKERSPFTKDFQLWSLITSQEARDSIRKIARGISGKSEEEILQEVGDLTGYLVQSIGSRTAKAAIRLTIYSIVSEVAKLMTGDDDDREKADKLLDKLTSPEFYAASLLAGIKDIALGGRNPFVRFMIDVAIERTYSMLFKEKQSKERKIDELEEQNLMDVSTVMGDFVTPPDLIRSYGAVGSVVSDIMRFGINYSSANEDDKAEKEYERKKLERAIAEVHGENSDMLKVVNDSYEMQEQLQERLKKNDFVSKEEKAKAITNLKISQGVTSVLLRMVSATTGIPYYQDIAQVTSTAAEEWLKDSASKLRTINETINKEFYGDDYNSWLKNNKIISGTGWSLEAQKKAAKELKELNDKYSSMEQAGRFLNITDRVLKEAYKQ